MNGEQHGAPPRWLTALEARVVGEYALMAAIRPALGLLESGDGHPVLVLPGFGASDRSTGPLRTMLGRLGYDVHGWDLGANLGPTPDIIAGLGELFERVAGDEQVSVVGWSLGGIYGREIARRYPDRVRQVISLGSPIHMVSGDPSAVTDLWDALRPMHDHSLGTIRESERPPVPVPTTAIYTRTDGIVHWRTCVQRRGPISENVEVFGSHCGLGFNASVVYVLADRLAQPVDAWQPFSSPLWLRGLFPAPASFEPAEAA